MATGITTGTIVWADSELKNQFVAKGVNGTIAGYMDCLIQYLTSTDAGGPFTTLGRNAGLIMMLEAIARPVITVARATWKVLGTAGTTAPTAAAIEAWIKTNPIKWNFDDNDPNKRYGRPELVGANVVIAEIIHGWLGDAATSGWTCTTTGATNGPLVQSKLFDDDVNSPTYSGLGGGSVILTPSQYAHAVSSMFRGLIKRMRYFATSGVQYPQYLSNNYPGYNQGPLLDDTNKNT